MWKIVGLQADDSAVRLLVDGDRTSATALRVAARRGGGDRSGGATTTALLSVAPRGSAAGARCVREMTSLQYVDVEAALGPDQVCICRSGDTQHSVVWRENKPLLLTLGWKLTHASHR